MLAVMGPSGSGKSTLLYQAAGMDAPSGGRVWLKETEITGLDEDGKAALRLHRMGFVFQQMNMMANLNILDNILLPAVQANRSRGVRKRAPGKSAGELAQEARALMEKLGLSGLEERRITQVYLQKYDEFAGNFVCRRAHRGFKPERGKGGYGGTDKTEPGGNGDSDGNP